MKRTTSYQICDGCGVSGLDSDVEFRTVFVKHGQQVFPSAANAKRLDVCMPCDEGGSFVCYRCEKVHKHEADCKYLREAQSESENPYLLTGDELEKTVQQRTQRY